MMRMRRCSITLVVPVLIWGVLMNMPEPTEAVTCGDAAGYIDLGNQCLYFWGNSMTWENSRINCLIGPFQQLTSLTRESSKAVKKYIKRLHRQNHGSYCIDNDGSCQGFAEAGECEKTQVWMTLNCAKSCGKCDDLDFAYWVGGSDRTSPGNWKWLNRRNVDVPWAPGQPKSGDGHCLAVNKTGFYAAPCNSKLLSICQVASAAFVNIKPGRCPVLPPQLFPASGASLPPVCGSSSSNDSNCPGAEKCCYDVFLNYHICMDPR